MSTNKICSIKITEEYYLPSNTSYTKHIDLSLEGFVMYETKKGSRKKIDKKTIHVPEGEMRAFFDHLYQFVREADHYSWMICDCYIKIEFIYSPYHTEIFECDVTYEVGDTLIIQLENFIETHK